MIKINTEVIRGLNPCEYRFNNYLSHYKDFDGALEEFLALDNITYNDKVWVVTRLMSINQLLKWSYLCAEPVLDIFEKSYPNDKRPRQALDALLVYINDSNDANMKLLRAAAANAANANTAYDATYAAYATAYADAANANTAYAAYAAANAAAYAAADAAAYAAAYAAYAAAYAAYAATREHQQDSNLLFMIEAVS